MNIQLCNYITEIEQLLSDEEHSEVIAHCQHVLSFFPKNLAIYRLYGLALLLSGDTKDAADLFYRVLSVVPDDVISHVGLAAHFEVLGDYPRASGHLTQAFEVQPYNTSIKEVLLKIRSIRNGGDASDAKMSRGALARIYLRGGNPRQAFEELSVALRSTPNIVSLRALMARTQYLMGHRVEAVNTSNELIEQLPYCAAANCVLFLTTSLIGRPNQAQDYFRHIHAVDPYLAERMSGDRQVDELEIPRLEYIQPSETDAANVPEWLRELGLVDDSRYNDDSATEDPEQESNLGSDSTVPIIVSLLRNQKGDISYDVMDEMASQLSPQGNNQIALSQNRWETGDESLDMLDDLRTRR
ncbi:MAG: hypothetical protein ABFQ89_02690 [Chloroflexota bacterium]